MMMVKMSIVPASNVKGLFIALSRPRVNPSEIYDFISFLFFFGRFFSIRVLSTRDRERQERI